MNTTIISRLILLFTCLATGLHGLPRVMAQEAAPMEGEKPWRFELSSSQVPAFVVTPSGLIYLIDRRSNEVRRYNVGGKLLASAGGFGLGTDEALDAPSDLAVQAELQVLVADYGNHRVVEYDARLNRISTLDGDPQRTGQRQFGFPRSVAFDRFGSVYIVDGENQRIVKYDRSRAFERTFGGSGAGRGQLHAPTRLRITDNDRVYVQDGNAVLWFDTFGNYVQTVAGPDSGSLHMAVYADNLYLLTGSHLRVINSTSDTTVALPPDIMADDLAAGAGVVYLRDRSGIRRFPFGPTSPSEREER